LDKEDEAMERSTFTDVRHKYVGKTCVHIKKDRKVLVTGLKKNCPIGTGVWIIYLDDNSCGTVTYRYLEEIETKTKIIGQCKLCEWLRENRCLKNSFFKLNQLINPDFGCWYWKMKKL
jgi:hypothetical protein